MKSSDALRIARDKIRTGHDSYVCVALPDAPSKVKDNLAKIFGLRQRYYTVDDFLNAQGAKLPALCSPLYEHELREYRLRWIDWMIEGYKMVGD